MKKVFWGLVLAAVLFLVAKPTLANEGVFHLVGPSEDGRRPSPAGISQDADPGWVLRPDRDGSISNLWTRLAW